jgi:hypothetical protein
LNSSPHQHVPYIIDVSTIGRPDMPFVLRRVLSIIHVLGWAGVVIGIAIFLFGDRARGTELMISGVGFIAAKYIAALIFLLLFKPAGNPPGESR